MILYQGRHHSDRGEGLDRRAGRDRVVHAQPLGHGLFLAAQRARAGPAALARRDAAAAAGRPAIGHHRAGRGGAARHSRCARTRGAARSVRQAGQSARQAAVENRNRLQCRALAARRHRRRQRHDDRDEPQRRAAHHRTGRIAGRQSRRHHHESAQRQSRPQGRRLCRQGARPARRFPRQCRGHLAAVDRDQLAARAEPHRLRWRWATTRCRSRGSSSMSARR